MNNPNLTGSAPVSTETEEKKGKFSIKVTDPEKFPNLLEGSILSLTDIMEKVSELFSSVYRDFAGCFITPLPNGAGFDTKLYFKETSPATDKDVYAFAKKDYNASGMSVQQAYSVLASRAKQKVYEVTQDGKDGLAKFISNQFKDGKGDVKWKSIINEETQNGVNSTTFAVVTGIDIYRVLSEIYGNKSPEGAYYQYMLNITRPISQTPGIVGSVNWLVSLQRIETSKLEELCRKVGMISSQGIPMVCAK